MMDVSIVIVSDKQRGLVKQVLKSIRLASVRLNEEVLVVDNASGDGLSELVHDQFPHTRLITLDRRVSAAQAHNLGMAKAKGRYVCLLRPDTLLLPGALEALVAVLDAHPRIGLVAPRVMPPDGTRQQGTIGEIMRDVDWTSAEAVCVRRTAIDEVGLFDPRFTDAFEDVDWCRRFREHGWRVTYLPQTRMIQYRRQKDFSYGQVADALKYFLKWRRPAIPEKEKTP